MDDLPSFFRLKNECFFKKDLPKRKVGGGIKLFSLRNFKLLQNAMNFAKSGGRW